MRIMSTGKGNVTTLKIGRMEFLFSYQTMVAFENQEGDCYITAEKFSPTTSKHINAWLDNRRHETVPAILWQAWADAFEQKFSDVIQDPDSFTHA